MATLQAADIPDLVTSTLRGLGRMKWSSMANRIQEYPGFKNLIRKERVKFEDGYEAQWNLMTDHSNGARHVGLYGQDSVNVPDGMIQARIPYRHTTTAWAFDEHEVTFNSGAAKIYDLVKSRRYMAMQSLAELIETAIWSLTAASDTLTPYGIPYYLVYNATTGFNGAAPTGYSVVANVNPTTYARWKNWSAQYTNVSKTDLISLVRQGARETHFMPPVDYPGYGSGNGYGYYVNGDTLQSLESILEAQNDNLGDAIDPKDGKAVLRRVKLEWVPKLDSGTPASADPFYGICWSEMGFRIPPGWFMKETGPQKAPTSHNVMNVFVDLSWALICYDRRRQFLVAKSDPSA